MNHTTSVNNTTKNSNDKIAIRRIISHGSPATHMNDSLARTNARTRASIPIRSRQTLSIAGTRSDHQHLRPNSTASQLAAPHQSKNDHPHEGNAQSYENASATNNANSGGVIRFSITISTTCPTTIGTPDANALMTVLYKYYPRQFEDFSQSEVINSITNYVSRHLNSFLPLKLSSPQVPPDSAEPTAMFYSISDVPISTHAYITRLVTFSKVTRVHFVLMLVYIDRIAKKSVALIPSPRNVHRLLASALAVAVETTGKLTGIRDALDKKHACRVAGIPSVQELTMLMKTFGETVDGDLGVSKEEIEGVYEQLRMMKDSTENAIAEENMSEMTRTTLT